MSFYLILKKNYMCNSYLCNLSLSYSLNLNTWILFIIQTEICSRSSYRKATLTKHSVHLYIIIYLYLCILRWNIWTKPFKTSCIFHSVNSCIWLVKSYKLFKSSTSNFPGVSYKCHKFVIVSFVICKVYKCKEVVTSSYVNSMLYPHHRRHTATTEWRVYVILLCSIPLIYRQSEWKCRT